ncbi:hypothetical protein SEA_DRHAYES_91 [Mycobacterium phage DrHayes]|uniref:Uncharacterized protein n=1 Tax=Mycobacterium phage Urkel TaxID=1912978 RepID=A0A1I9S4X2_9CAUD|nr:hypothetical protein I5H07_gp12 [Mycobacterium phage Urkel]AOZ61422.1 hypothetical protein SEA_SAMUELLPLAQSON_91 [Mycobacterium phage SamuelLPlaqson]AOZ61519.1 hypothetical protein SEA_DRHAYES_91 [Mycobacterium phage DrHayes]AOZ61616.1 hypothetical protein SEA_URKEL_91 [Mycobacterium phage Urkel]
MFTMVVQMHGRQEVTEHATIAEARERLVDIAVASGSRIEGDDTTGEFILRDRDGRDRVLGWTFGAYRITEAAAEYAPLPGGEVEALFPGNREYVAVLIAHATRHDGEPQVRSCELCRESVRLWLAAESDWRTVRAARAERELAAATARYMIDERLDADTVQMMRNSDRDGRGLLAAIVAEWLKLHPALPDRERHAVTAAAHGWQRFDTGDGAPVRYAREGEGVIIDYRDGALRIAERWICRVIDAMVVAGDADDDPADVDRWLAAAPVPL